MKKILLGMGIVFGVAAFTLSANAMPMYTAPNAGNSSFLPMMQSQMEKQETLDFVNDSENYKKKREAKYNSENAVRESNFNPNYSPNYGGTYLHPVHPVQMQFSKDANGNIKIQGIQSNSETIINTK
ncbi:hypothetical protein IJ596_04615 [bacterium]|nr:hypothetical protein [bacterium]